MLSICEVYELYVGSNSISSYRRPTPLTYYSSKGNMYERHSTGSLSTDSSHSLASTTNISAVSTASVADANFSAVGYADSDRSALFDNEDTSKDMFDAGTSMNDSLSIANDINTAARSTDLEAPDPIHTDAAPLLSPNVPPALHGDAIVPARTPVVHTAASSSEFPQAYMSGTTAMLTPTPRTTTPTDEALSPELSRAHTVNDRDTVLWEPSRGEALDAPSLGISPPSMPKLAVVTPQGERSCVVTAGVTGAMLREPSYVFPSGATTPRQPEEGRLSSHQIGAAVHALERDGDDAEECEEGDNGKIEGEGERGVEGGEERADETHASVTVSASGADGGDADGEENERGREVAKAEEVGMDDALSEEDEVEDARESEDNGLVADTDVNAITDIAVNAVVHTVTTTATDTVVEAGLTAGDASGDVDEASGDICEMASARESETGKEGDGGVDRGLAVAYNEDKQDNEDDRLEKTEEDEAEDDEEREEEREEEAASEAVRAAVEEADREQVWEIGDKEKEEDGAAGEGEAEAGEKVGGGEEERASEGALAEADGEDAEDAEAAAEASEVGRTVESADARGVARGQVMSRDTHVVLVTDSTTNPSTYVAADAAIPTPTAVSTYTHVATAAAPTSVLAAPSSPLPGLPHPTVPLASPRASPRSRSPSTSQAASASLTHIPPPSPIRAPSTSTTSATATASASTVVAAAASASAAEALALQSLLLHAHASLAHTLARCSTHYCTPHCTPHCKSHCRVTGQHARTQQHTSIPPGTTAPTTANAANAAHASPPCAATRAAPGKTTKGKISDSEIPTPLTGADVSAAPTSILWSAHDFVRTCVDWGLCHVSHAHTYARSQHSATTLDTTTPTTGAGAHATAETDTETDTSSPLRKDRARHKVGKKSRPRPEVFRLPELVETAVRCASVYCDDGEGAGHGVHAPVSLSHIAAYYMRGDSSQDTFTDAVVDTVSAATDVADSLTNCSSSVAGTRTSASASASVTTGAGAGAAAGKGQRPAKHRGVTHTLAPLSSSSSTSTATSSASAPAPTLARFLLSPSDTASALLHLAMLSAHRHMHLTSPPSSASASSPTPSASPLTSATAVVEAAAAEHAERERRRALAREKAKREARRGRGRGGRMGKEEKGVRQERDRREGEEEEEVAAGARGCGGDENVRANSSSGTPNTDTGALEATTATLPPLPAHASAVYRELWHLLFTFGKIRPEKNFSNYFSHFPYATVDTGGVNGGVASHPSTGTHTNGNGDAAATDTGTNTTVTDNTASTGSLQCVGNGSESTSSLSYLRHFLQRKQKEDAAPQVLSFTGLPVPSFAARPTVGGSAGEEVAMKGENGGGTSGSGSVGMGANGVTPVSTSTIGTTSVSTSTSTHTTHTTFPAATSMSTSAPASMATPRLYAYRGVVDREEAQLLATRLNPHSPRHRANALLIQAIEEDGRAGARASGSGSADGIRGASCGIVRDVDGAGVGGVSLAVHGAVSHLPAPLSTRHTSTHHTPAQAGVKHTLQSLTRTPTSHSSSTPASSTPGTPVSPAPLRTREQVIHQIRAEALLERELSLVDAQLAAKKDVLASVLGPSAGTGTGTAANGEKGKGKGAGYGRRDAGNGAGAGEGAGAAHASTGANPSASASAASASTTNTPTPTHVRTHVRAPFNPVPATTPTTAPLPTSAVSPTPTRLPVSASSSAIPDPTKHTLPPLFTTPQPRAGSDTGAGARMTASSHSHIASQKSPQQLSLPARARGLPSRVRALSPLPPLSPTSTTHTTPHTSHAAMPTSPHPPRRVVLKVAAKDTATVVNGDVPNAKGGNTNVAVKVNSRASAAGTGVGGAGAGAGVSVKRNGAAVKDAPPVLPAVLRPM